VNIIQFSASANGTRNLGIGGGPNLMAREIVTADDLHTDGEAAIAANGGRYAWLWSSDHYDNTTAGWARGGGVYIGFTNDIAIPPKVGREVIAHSFVIGGDTYVQAETPWPLWKVEDVTDPIRIYVHAVNSTRNRQETVVLKSADWLTWAIVGVSHGGAGTGGHHYGYQLVFRNGENDYWSFGLNGEVAASTALWTSTDAETFTEGAARSPGLAYGTGASFLIGAQRYIIGKEDTTSSTDEGLFIALAPIDDNYDAAGSLTRISAALGQLDSSGYPGPKYMQSVEYAIEDGIAHIFPKRGFFADTGLIGGADYADGGGYDNQICDYYRYIIDETAARASAPAGVRASAAGGVVTLQWYNALPQSTYRVERSTSSDMSGAVLVGDVSGTSITDTPGSPGTYYYRVTTLNNGSEEKNRIVSPYVSSRSELVNAHVERVLAAGAPLNTIDLDHVAWVESILDELGIKNDLAYWVMPEMGHIKNESNVLSKIFCLGSTIHPRGGDLTFATTGTTYSATAWDNLPGWVAAAGTDRGYFGSGRLNNIRRARNSGLTLIGSFQRPSTGLVTLMASGEFVGYYLQATAGSPGACKVGISRSVNTYDTDTHATTLANGSPHIIGGVFTSSRVTAFVEGVAGSGADRGASTSLTDRLNGQRGSGGGTVHFLGIGSQDAKMNAAESSASRSYSFGNSQAAPISRHRIAIRRGLTDEQYGTLITRLRAGP